MANTENSAEALFYLGKMNKDYDERFIQQGEYIDALNIRVGSTELGASSNSDLGSVGALENSKGNTLLTDIKYVSGDALCIGSYEDGSNETIYWFVTSTDVDVILSYETTSKTTTYHVVSEDVLNFDSKYLINGINKVDDLLFWTDNLNPPRRINITKSYPINGIDESDISVIVAPPMDAPVISLFNAPGEENYMSDKFASFSYRYKYENGEYSALSQFSDIAFEPGEFEIDYSRFVNTGMTNSFNSVLINFNTGSKNVVGIDVCFKLSNSNIVNVIEKFDKKKEEWLDNKPKSLVFTNRKIYTTLPESELLRLYDNVPRFAKAQTTIGNRLMYGNYVDGYDVGSVDYSLEVISESIVDNTLNVTYTPGSNYTIDPAATKTINNSNLNIDFTGYPLTKGYQLSIDFNIVSDSYSGNSNFNTPTSPGPGSANDFSYNFSFLLQQDYQSVYQMANSQEFIDAISTHLPYAQASDGASLTDFFNEDKVAKQADSETGFGIWEDIDSGITGTNGAFLITSSVGSNVIGIQCPAVKFVTENPVGTFLYAYQYFYNSSTDVYYNKLGAKRSLHSNRDYEVAIVYMDDYLRSSTALVDTDNTVFIKSNKSSTINNIRVSLNSYPPSWATKYKFVLKQSLSSYETIYTNLFFVDDSGNTWFKLDGDNRQKVKEDQTLIVKKDTSGVLSSLTTTTVLEIVAQGEDFIENNKNSNGEDIIEPAGLYMRLRPSGFSAEYDPDSFRDNGNLSSKNKQAYYFDELNPAYIPGTDLPTNRKYRPFAVPVGSRIKFKIRQHRDGTGGSCDDYIYEYEKTFVSSKDYDNMYEWFVGDNVDVTTGSYAPGGEGPINSVQYDEFQKWTIGTTGDYGNWTNYYFWQTENVTADGGTSVPNNQGRLKFTSTTGVPCCRCGFGGINPKYTRVDLHITVQTGSGDVIFESEPDISNGEIYFENSQNFDIVKIDNSYYHNGNVQNQTVSQPVAIIDLDFFNCFTFGNGVESYKINDSLTGVGFYLGSRVTAVSQEDFKEAHRYAGITYSGIYNAETNINKLNEFNLALVNWKDCEKSFGPINVLHGRKTDVLVLQEDKVSNVLVGKNLLSDAAGGGAITATPEVLGTQIARIEEYGISSNAESFAVYGYDSYFTDVKRGVVLNLKEEQLIPISSYGMNSWFRDRFKNRVGNQNIGGYDPYMKEYVLSLSDNELPVEPKTYNCGSIISQDKTSSPYSFIVNVGSIIGDVVIDYNFYSGESGISVMYNGDNVINTTKTGSGSVSFYKDSIDVEFMEVFMTPDEATYNILVNCPLAPEVTVIRISLNSVDDIGKTIHNNYNWTAGTHTSAYNTDFIMMEDDGVSLYDADTAPASYGVIPAYGSTVKMSSNKNSGDTFVFNGNDFKYLISDDLYTEAQINDLKPELDTATPVYNPSTGNYEASFIYANPSSFQYLYLVWDYTIHTAIDLCYSATSAYDSCTSCYGCPDCVSGLPVLIGTQEWTNCNLDVTTYANGDTIPQVTDPTAWAALTTGAWCYYDNDSANGTTYGKLYNWYAVNDPRGLAPVGYHVPTDAEWNTLIGYLDSSYNPTIFGIQSTIAGGKLKETGLCHWNTPNTGATNERVFTALPGGYRFALDGVFSGLDLQGVWWSSSAYNIDSVFYRSMFYNDGNAYRASFDKENGCSVRLIKDDIS